MSNWDESKHPRDKDGKFTDLGNMSAKDLAGKLQMPNLTKQEWALFYERIGKIKAEGHFVPKSPNGDMMIGIESENDCVLVITGGTYMKPKVKKIIRFTKKQDLYDFIEVYSV